MFNEKQLEFVIFLLHNLALEWNKEPSDVYKILNDSNILDGYIIKCYDTLHTLGRQYLVNDITELVNERGIKI